MSHSNQIREFVITDKGLDLVPVYVGVDGNIFIGAARAAKASEEREAARIDRDNERTQLQIRRQRRKAFKAEEDAMRARFIVQEQEYAAEELLREQREKKAARAAERQHRLAVTNPPIQP